MKKLQKTLDKIAKKCWPPRYINYFTEAYMQYFSSDQVYSALMSSIDSLFLNRQEFLNNPKSAFTRTKKISFRQAILFPMLAGSDNVATELLDFFGEDNLPLPSAMIQRRNQIKSEAFQELFYEFSQKVPIKETYHGYQLVACDGSRINLPYNPSDSFNFLQSIEGRKGINQVHLNALYDPLNDIFLDAELQGIHQMHEKAAFCRFLDKHKDSEQKRIYIADRGYASYNVLGHAIHNKQLFLIRASEKYAKGLCSRKGWLCDSFADENITIHIGRRELKQFKEFENFHCVKVQRQYDYSEVNDTKPDKLCFRVLKFPIAEDSYEYILTNLPAYSFSADEIKKLYNLRWGQETAFRHLKYAGNMVHIHSLKKEFIMQEIYAKLPIACRGQNYTVPCSSSDLTRSGRIFLRDVLKLREQQVSGISYLIQHSDSVEKDPTTYLLRRNFATHLYTLGFPIEWCQYYMGHLIESDIIKRSDFNDEGFLYQMALLLEKHPLNHKNHVSEIIIPPSSTSRYFIMIENKELDDPLSVRIKCSHSSSDIIVGKSTKKLPTEIDITKYFQ